METGNGPENGGEEMLAIGAGRAMTRCGDLRRAQVGRGVPETWPPDFGDMAHVPCT